MAIKNWPEGERPREKLQRRGAAALSDAEILAIFLRTGYAGQSAVDLARNLLAKFGGLGPLLSSDTKILCAEKGLGRAKCAQLQAVVELAHRYAGEKLERESVFTTPGAVAAYLRIKLQGQPREVFSALFLDTRHQLIADEVLFQGTLDGAQVYPREVVKRALYHNAAAVIFAHNHPSGVAEPSGDDIRITQRLKEALSLVDVRVLDHLVVGAGEAVSLADRGHL